MMEPRDALGGAAAPVAGGPDRGPHAWPRRVGAALYSWGLRVRRHQARRRLHREACRVLIFFHRDSLAHTVRPLLIGRALRQRGYPVEFAGVGRHRARIADEGFCVHPVESMPQSYIDERVARCEYDYYDEEWTERCVAAERRLLRQLGPDLVIGDFRPTLFLSCPLQPVELAYVVQGYNLPTYPHMIRLPECFPAGSVLGRGRLTNAAEMRGRPPFFLVADIPQLHPPGGPVPSGYHYVGPLVETVPEPASIPELDPTGWDLRRPLVYLNCGSTGAQPAYLDHLLGALAKVGVRVVATTAGRWSGHAPDPNIRVVDFLPANWVLRHAALLVGIGGIGSIYHALAQGVPIVGAPEHIDQEYHLNRVRDLGLGLKLNWDGFQAVEPLVGAIRAVLGELDSYRQRCCLFSPHVRCWSAGEAAGDVVEAYILGRETDPQIQARYGAREPEFLRHLELSTPQELPADALRRMLRRGYTCGLPHHRAGAATLYDRADSWNWLYDNDPAFFGADYRALEARRQAFFVSRTGAVVAARTEQRYRLTYTFRLYAGTLSGGAALLAVPALPDPRQSPDRTEPADLHPPGDGILPDCARGLLLRVPHPGRRRDGGRPRVLILL
ncbi:MAG: nucleotide disphospho-sugar-binding domain-containing protein [Candidatus Latescibacterota bacterium]